MVYRNIRIFHNALKGIGVRHSIFVLKIKRGVIISTPVSIMAGKQPAPENFNPFDIQWRLVMKEILKLYKRGAEEKINY